MILFAVVFVGSNVTLLCWSTPDFVFHTDRYASATTPRESKNNPRAHSVPTNGLIHHWTFDEGAGPTAADTVGSVDGTLMGPLWEIARGVVGSALRFDGLDDYVDLGTMDIAATTGLTIALWFRADDFDILDARFISKATSTSGDDHYWMLSTVNATALRVRLKTADSTTTLPTGTGEVEAGRWYHTALTYDGSHMRIYRNAVEVAGAPKTGILNANSMVFAAIGNQPPGAGSSAFDGLIDEIMIYDRALDIQELASLLRYFVSTPTVGSGSVLRSPDQESYSLGDTVIVTAVPDPGWLFQGWSQGLTGTQNPDTIIVASDTTVTAIFTRDGFGITTDVFGDGTVTLDPDMPSYSSGDTVVATATPAPGWWFSTWLGGLTGNQNPHTIVVSCDTTVIAMFETEVDLRFAVFGDYGDGGATAGEVADLVKSFSPDLIATTGDNGYGPGPVDYNVGQFYSDYIGNYAGNYGPGSVPNRFFPTLGNHDYTDGGGIAAYLNYFTLSDTGILDNNTSGNERYYDFVRGPVHFFMVNSCTQEPDGRTSASTQAQWLQTQLALSTSPWNVVCLHHPPYSSGSKRGSEIDLQWPYEDWGAHVVFAGHDHLYERLLIDDNGDNEEM
ncbi:MAG: metallophosphoesterase, partial [Candidatus Latescibacterota bacterium]